MVRWIRWHCPPDTGFEIRNLAVWGRARYFSVMEAPHNSESLQVRREETFCFFETWRPEWGSSPRLSKHADLTTAPGPPPGTADNWIICFRSRHASLSNFIGQITTACFCFGWQLRMHYFNVDCEVNWCMICTDICNFILSVDNNVKYSNPSTTQNFHPGPKYYHLFSDSSTNIVFWPTICTTP